MPLTKIYNTFFFFFLTAIQGAFTGLFQYFLFIFRVVTFAHFLSKN